MRAFCSKHSDNPTCSEPSPSTIGGKTYQAAFSSETLQNRHNESGCGRKYQVFRETQLEIPSNSVKVNGELVDVDIQNGGFVMNREPEKCNSQPSACAEAVKNNGAGSVKPSVTFLLKKVPFQVIVFNFKSIFLF